MVSLIVPIAACGQPGNVDGPVVSHLAEPTLEGLTAEIAGTLDLDDDCLYVDQTDLGGGRFPVVWPRGASWVARDRAVEAPTGRVAVGDAVQGAGGYLYLSAVRDLVGPEGTEALADCLGDGTEIAVFNNHPNATLTP